MIHWDQSVLAKLTLYAENDYSLISGHFVFTWKQNKKTENQIRENKYIYVNQI